MIRARLNKALDFSAGTALTIASIFSFAAIAFYVGIALIRIRYPYELDWLESGMVEHARRVAHDQPLYTAPSANFVQFPYPPIYMWVSGLFAAIFGTSFETLRVISFVASLGSFYLLYRIVRRETTSYAAGLVAVGVFAASYQRAGSWFDVGKVDSLFLLFTLLAIELVATAQTRRRFVVAAAVMAVAILTKQTALFVAAPVGAFLVVTRWRDGLLWSAVVLGTLAVFTAVLQITSHGWFTYWVWEQLLEHGHANKPWTSFFLEDLDVFRLVAVIAVLAGFHLFRRLHLRTTALYAAACVGLVAGSWVSRMHEGGAANVIMPACAAMALIVGISLGYLVKECRNHFVPLAALVVCLIQLLDLRYSVKAQVPTSADKTQGAALIAAIHNIPGDVLVINHPTYAVMAGKPSHGQELAGHDVFRSTDAKAKRILRDSYAEAVHSKQYSAILLDESSDEEVLPADWRDYYQWSFVDLGITENDFRGIASNTKHPSQVWLRKP